MTNPGQTADGKPTEKSGWAAERSMPCTEEYHAGSLQVFELVDEAGNSSYNKIYPS
ncbi:hypothetical protein DPMN_066267 [Dreissena polymorpha]|uniref:Uncharacterized protein n=1 Tax=Dreissena polymorpha TaxID=45954 RepID=A0A9D4BKB8_DREPO|nr:hypothetical protein DPMN_066267 [Dreissena polymorpha]